MKFSFPDRLLADAAAAGLGYEGLEVAYAPDSGASAGDVRSRAGELEIACLATKISMSASARERRATAPAAVALRDTIDVAQALDCRLVRILDPVVPRGTTPVVAAVEMARWLLPLADHAGRRGVTIVVANAQSFRTARPLWTLLETISHPNVAASWDLLDGFRAGQSPHVAVPTLNTRIQYVRLSDADMQFQPSNLGEGQVPVREFLDRLRGVGYGGYVTYAPATPEDLGPALAKLKEWTKPPVAEKAKKAVPLHK